MEPKKLYSNTIADVYKFTGNRGDFEGVISRPQQEKIVFILSTLYGCPVKCPICDAAGHYNGPLSVSELTDQFEYLLNQALNISNYKKVKIQFSRMGEPAFNRNVIDTAYVIMNKYPHLKPVISISSIVPAHCDRFFTELGDMLFKFGNRFTFQIQFSIHSTDKAQRERMIPVQKTSLKEMGFMGSVYSSYIKRKITLNFALHNHSIIDTDKLMQYFPPHCFIIKLTPVNPTDNAISNNISTCSSTIEWDRLLFHADNIRRVGYEVIESIGDFRENQVLSNCGQYVKNSVSKK